MFNSGQIEEIKELVHSIHNRSHAVLLLMRSPDNWQYLPTILEDLLKDAQEIVLEYMQKET